MKQEEFNLLLERRLEQIRSTLVRKAGEYASNTDRLHNFKAAGAMLRSSAAQACLGFMTKHLVSVFDIVQEMDAGVIREGRNEQIDEKVGDAINYLILLEAILKEKKA